MIHQPKVKLALTTKLLSVGLDVSVIPSLILSFLSDTLVRDILPWGEKESYCPDLWCTHSNTHKYIKHPSEARLEFRHMVLWFVIAVWAVKAASTSSDLNVHLTNTSCVYLTSMTHVQSVWRHMRREVWYTHTCGNVRKPVEKKTVKWGMIGMFTRTSHTCHPDVRCTWGTLCCVVCCVVLSDTLPRLSLEQLLPLLRLLSEHLYTSPVW